MSDEGTPRPQESPAAAPRGGRIVGIDIWRGLALLAMFAYHFSYDLNYFRVIRQDFLRDPFWLAARALILGSFLLLVGVGLVLATRRSVRWRPFLRRLGLIAACSMLVSLGTYAAFPRSWVFFGVLHHIAVASLLGLAFVRLGWANLPIGLAIVGIGTFVKLRAFDAAPLRWVGLMTYTPVVEDYVPMLPWFGVVLLGIFLGNQIVTEERRPADGSTHRPAAPIRLLAFLGRHTLFLYMVHQPVFFGLLHLILRR